MTKNTKKRAVIYSNVKQNKKRAEEKNKLEDQQINLSDEVIIGFNTKKNNQRLKKNETNKVKSTLKKESTDKPNNKNRKKQKNNKLSKKVVKKTKRKIKIPRVVKVGALLIILSIAMFAFLKSSIFNIKEIVVQVDNNNVLTESEIKELSKIAIGENMFSINKNEAIQNIKTNSYVEEVKIKRSIPNKLRIVVTERLIKFQIATSEGYVYVDKHGMVVDKSTQKKDCITITGNQTEYMTNGDKLCDEDINRLSDVLQIFKEAENNELQKDITRIDISNCNDYLVYFDDLGKVAHIGDSTSMNDKLTRVAKILKEESEYEGEIFVNVDLNNGEYPYFREKV